MKKSKIIIPALAMIAFSAAASISGAVAWFTASRQATINAGTYAVVKTNADLACQVEDGVGVVSASNPQGDGARVVSLSGNDEVSKLTDGSFNHEESTFITPSSDGKSFQQDLCDFKLGSEGYAGKLLRSSSTVAGVTTNIYTAVTWKMTFTISFGAVPGDVGLFLDYAASSYTVSGGDAAVTAKGFRTAFIPTGANKANGETHVFAKLQTTENCRYVPSYVAPTGDPATTNMSGQAYADDNVLIASDAGLTALPENSIDETTGSARKDYFGKFVFSSGSQVTLSFDVVCWFEGTDPTIVNRTVASEYQSVVSTLSFKALNLTNA